MENNLKSENSKLNIFLADIIYVFHIIIILFVILAPISNIPAILILHVVFCISLIVHWVGNNNACSLTYFESYLRGLDNTSESFSYKFIAPIYDISKTEWSKICYIVTITALLISIYKLYYSDKVTEAFQCYNNLNKDPNFNNLSFYDRLKQTSKCFITLFKIID